MKSLAASPTWLPPLLPTEIHIVNSKEDKPPNEGITLKLSHPLIPKTCPQDSLVLYTTSLRGIRKTFDDCTTVTFLLDSFHIAYLEKDVSMHLEYREELWKLFGGRVIPPRLFIRDRYIGGADEVVELHERGKLQSLLQGITRRSTCRPCSGCGGMRFVLCTSCNGSRKMVDGEGRRGLSIRIRCPHCNENGLIKCFFCSQD